MDVLTIPFIGERWRWQYPFRSLRAAGAVLAMGSDWSVSTREPDLGDAYRGRAPAPAWYAGDRGVLLPEERLDLIDALAAFTSGSAYVNHLDADTGTLEVGKFADLAVLDRDLFDRGAGEIGDATVVGTFVEGVAVHETPELEG